MGWASEALERDLARAGIFPICIDDCETRTEYDSERKREERKREEKKEKKEKKEEKKPYFHDYNFPTDAQVRALRFITIQTGLIFTGSTKQEAREFISEYMDYARECAEE